MNPQLNSNSSSPFVATYHAIWRLLVQHANAFLDDFDAMKDVVTLSRGMPQVVMMVRDDPTVKAKKKRFNGHYILPWIIMAYVAVDMLYQLASVDFQYRAKFHELTQMYSHRCFPRPLHADGDVIWAMALYMALVLYSMMILDTKMLDPKYRMYAQVDEARRLVQMVENGRGN